MDVCMDGRMDENFSENKAFVKIQDLQNNISKQIQPYFEIDEDHYE